MKKLFLFLSFIIITNHISAEGKISLKSLETLARQGDLASQIELANVYRKGIGITQDYKRAVQWFTLAAEQGDAVSQYNLGIMYSFGLGVVPDYKPAVKWYTMAAEQGNPLAQYNLGRLYYLGKGVPENLVYSYMWANQASSNGFDMGSELTELLTELITVNQIEAAIRLGHECVIMKYKGCQADP